jgi:cytokinesis protein
MLEGLQSGASLNKDGSLSVRRRRESADTERQRRRNRRNQATSTAKSEEGGLMSPNTIPEEVEGDVSLLDDGPSTPVTVVHPPSPEQKGRELPTPPPEGE